MTSMFHDGNRVMQDRFDTGRIADRIAEVKVGDTIDERDLAFIESRDMFFLATADALPAKDPARDEGREVI